jgi:hypothetical protein
MTGESTRGNKERSVKERRLRRLPVSNGYSLGKAVIPDTQF